MTVPNAITGTGIFFTFLYVVAYLSGNTTVALVSFCAVCLSDLLDGFFARVLNQVTRFGAIIDVVRDKFFFAAIIGNILYVNALTKYETGWLAAVVSAEVVVWVVAVYICRSLGIIPSVRLHGLSRLRQCVFISVFLLVLARAYFGLVIIHIDLLIPLVFAVSLFTLVRYSIFIAKNRPPVR